MAVPIPPMLKYSIVYNFINFRPIFITSVSKFIVCKVLYFKAQHLLRLRSPFKINDHTKKSSIYSEFRHPAISLFYLFHYDTKKGESGRVRNDEKVHVMQPLPICKWTLPPQLFGPVYFQK